MTLIRLVASGVIGTILAAAILAVARAIPATDPPTQPVAQERESKQSASPKESAKRTKTVHVQVLDDRGQGVANVDVEASESGRKEAAAFTDAAGRARVVVDAFLDHIHFLARPNDRLLGWSVLKLEGSGHKGTEGDPTILTLLPLDHRIEGSVVDSSGKPIHGVRIQVEQIRNPKNEWAHSSHMDADASRLGSALTDDTGRYALVLPAKTDASFSAYHPHYVGPSFHCAATEQKVPPVTLERAGRIVGRVVDAPLRKPVPGAVVAAQLIEIRERILGGASGSAKADANGRFEIGGLEPGVYNLRFAYTPRGKSFVAAAVEGVRVKDGEDAEADLTMIQGCRLHGLANDIRTGEPLVGTQVFYYSAQTPRSGAACKGIRTDDHGRFEFFVPPGKTYVYLADGNPQNLRLSRKTLTARADREPEPILLQRGGPPDDRAPVNNIECDALVQSKLVLTAAHEKNAARVLFGRVLNQDRAPIAGVEVISNPPMTATDREGKFILNGLRSGPLRVQLRKSGYQSRVATVPADALEVEFEIPNQPDEPE
jgi:protocatechuate 3,4-dioxygenase beta subunit